MADDIAKLKIGQKPSGESVQKSVGPQLPTVEPQVTPATPAPRPAPASQLELGKVEKSKPLAAPIGIPTPPVSRPTPPTPPKPSLGPTSPTRPIAAPPAPSGGRGKRILLVSAVVIVLLVGGYLVYALLGSSGTQVAQETPTPSSGAFPSATPTPAPAVTLASIFGADSAQVDLANSGMPLQELGAQTDAMPAVSQGFTELQVLTASKGTEPLSAREVLDRLLVSYPPALRTALAGDSALFLYGQNEVFDAKGIASIATTPQKRYVFVFEVADATLAQSTMQQWESDMPTALVGLFDINPVTGSGFLDNTSQGATIRYQNFPYPDRSIDYAFVSYGERVFLVISGSREATYAALHKLQ